MTQFHSDTPEAVREVIAAAERPEIVKAQEATAAKIAFERLVRSAVVRAEMLPRGHIAPLGFAVADLMLMGIVTGRYKPKSAKEAIDIAKAAQEIARRETGDADTTIVIRGPEQRQAAVDRVVEIRAQIEQRAIDSGRPIVDAEIVEEPDTEVSIPRSAQVLAELRTLRGVKHAPTEES